jgi:DNA-binding ferritin-like protein (Dps family)
MKPRIEKPYLIEDKEQKEPDEEKMKTYYQFLTEAQKEFPNILFIMEEVLREPKEQGNLANLENLDLEGPLVLEFMDQLIRMWQEHIQELLRQHLTKGIWELFK